MSFIIEDGIGKGNKAQVNSDNKLIVRADVNQRATFISKDDGEVYNWNSSFSANSGEEIIYVRNISTTKNLIVSIVRAGSTENSLFEVFNVSDSTTPAGTTSTGQNLNLGSGNTPDSSSMGGAAITFAAIGERLATARASANTSVEIPFDDTLILGQNNAITMTYTGNTASTVAVTIRGYFDDEV